MATLLTPRQVALAIGASESSLKRWCDKGTLPVVRTAGGHRRLAVDQVLEFLRQTGQPLVRPELLGLPSATGQGAFVIDRAAGQLAAALLAGDEEQCQRIVLDLFLAKHRLAEIFDRVIAAAFVQIGQAWECGEAQVYEERRGCEIALRLLHRLRAMLPAAGPAAPRALGGTLSGDHYQLPTAMVELVLRDLGWAAQSLGTSLPRDTWLAALEAEKPQLLWLSVSHLPDEPQFLADYAAIQAAAMERGVPVVVGGYALAPEVRSRMQYAAYGDQLRHLVGFVQALRSEPAKPDLAK
ncbi:MAG: cobalamin-dependent protein [Pirellulales bacterium]